MSRFATRALTILALTMLIAPVATFAEESCTDLLAGQHMDAGDVCTEIVDGELCVTYSITGDWELDAYHLWIGGDVADMPQTKKGSPKLGHFPYSETDLSGWDTPVTSRTVCVAPEELALDEWCDLSEVKVVAHAVVARDGDKDGLLDTFETGYGDGFELGGRSWATGTSVALCYEDTFDAAGLDLELAGYATGGENDGVVGLTVQHQGGNAGEPYFRGELDYDQDGTAELSDLPFYCVDLANTIASNQEYCALMISSYNPNVGNLAGIVNEQNLDLANYVLNAFSIGDDLANSAPVTGGDIQRTLWALVFGDLPNAGAFASGPSDDANVNAMLAAAAMFGEGFEPPCDGVVAVILYPVACDPDGIVAQALIAQALVTDFAAGCTSVCMTCCGQ